MNTAKSNQNPYNVPTTAQANVESLLKLYQMAGCHNQAKKRYVRSKVLEWNQICCPRYCVDLSNAFCHSVCHITSKCCHDQKMSRVFF